MLPEGPLRSLAKVESLVGDLVDRGAALVDLSIAAQLWGHEDGDHPLDPIAELIGGRACPRVLNPGEREDHNHNR